jgi:hypothetical protein
MTSKTIFVPENEHLKCAPSKIYSDGSCFSIDSLTKIAFAYNLYIGNKTKTEINITDSKINLVNDITNRIISCNNNQLCWLELDWVKNINNTDINNNTFRPLGPQGKFNWLSTTNINDIIKQYETKYTDFKFLGTVPYNFEDLSYLNISNINLDKLNININKIGLVINLDEHWQSGSHWVSLFADISKDQIFFFDSYGIKPKPRITDFVKKIALWCYKKHHLKIETETNNNLDTESLFMRKKKNKYELMMDINYNKVRHQYKYSECGVYSINFILRLLKGESFNNICSNITTDAQINECRKTYFRFE